MPSFFEPTDVPKYYAYKSGSGGYIQTQIDDSPQTLQVVPSAESLLSELGYEYGEYLPRDVTKPLVIIGVIGTKPYGRSKFELLDGMPALASNYCELSSEQQTRLRAFLQNRTADLSTDEYEYLRQFLTNESPLDPVSRPDTDDHATGTDHSHDPNSAPDIDSIIEAIPVRLRELDQWLCWRIETRNGKETKVPVSPHDDGFASVDDPSTWASFDVAVEAAQQGDIAGLGFVFTDKDTIAGIDLDDMRDPDTGSITDRARDILETVNSYTEVSPSGTGLHVLLRGFVPNGRQRHDGIELYDSGRFFTVTGQRLDSYPDTVAVRHDQLQSVQETHVARDTDDRTTSRESPRESTPTVPDTDKTETEIIEYGQRKPKFRRLWNGDTSGYKSHSEADLAMCVLLAYYTGDNRRLMDSVFRQSGLMRNKWDEQRGEQTYGDLTIDEAIRIVDTYDPHLHGMDAASPQEAIAQLEAGQKATIEATVVEVESVPSDAIEQAGELQDDSGQIRFVVWASEYWDPDVHFSEGDTYRIADGWIDEYQGQRQIQINEHTAVEKLERKLE